jgi:hypothetical protein
MRKLPIESDVSVSFSPDGKRFAYTESHSAVHETLLKVANADGTDVKTLLTAQGEKRVLPVFRSNPVSWSRTARRSLARFKRPKEMKSGSVFFLVDPEDGSERYLSEERWQYVAGIVMEG